MAPKKKKTKEELEAERLAKEEEERLAEEERLRQEEEERKRREEEEQERQRLMELHLQEETERLETERHELEELVGDWSRSKAEVGAATLQEKEWQRCLRCTHLPYPLLESQMNDYYVEMDTADNSSVAATLQGCEESLLVIQECEAERLIAQEQGFLDRDRQISQHLATLHSVVDHRIDSMSAHALQYSDLHANDKGEVKMEHRTTNFKWAVWVNIHKNPRLKSVPFPTCDIHVDIAKQLALSPIAMRCVHYIYDPFYEECTNDFMAIGGVLKIDLLQLPPAARRLRGWILRQVTPLASAVQRVPYPIPPAGADPATWVSEEQPSPLGITLPMRQGQVLLGSSPTVGWWDAESKSWSTQGVSNVETNSTAGTLKFHTTKLAPLAILVSRRQLLPYQSWYIRPTAGERGHEASITLDVGLSMTVEINAGAGWVELRQPRIRQLDDVLERRMQPRQLLQELTHRGLPLLPSDRDAPYAGVSPKQRMVEQAACDDMALMASTFLLSGAKWNQKRGADECLWRFSEITDWDDGGRTTLENAQRIFSLEKEEGLRQVSTMLRKGMKGVTHSGALDRRVEYPELPSYDTMEYEESLYGEVHVSTLTLLSGSTSEKHRDSELDQRLSASTESLARMQDIDPLFAETLTRLLLALRIFSFG